VTADVLTGTAFGGWSSERIITNAPLPSGNFDYIASLPRGNEEALKQKVLEKFGVTAHVETREMDVLNLQIKTAGAPGLKPHTGDRKSSGSSSGNGRYTFKNEGITGVAWYAEGLFKVPVIDHTNLKGQYDVDLHWTDPDPYHAFFAQALLDQLGLELVPSKANLKVLVIDKAE
jgi:uncharacterized protein (TIGR03435 family)